VDETEEPVALPQLTDEQRAAALEKAAAARRARAELKDRLKARRHQPQACTQGCRDQRGLRQDEGSALLEALPKVGKVKAQEIMTELEIAPTRRVARPGRPSAQGSAGKVRLQPATSDLPAGGSDSDERSRDEPCVVLSGPSAVGKSTVVRCLREPTSRPGLFGLRHHQAPRPGEVDGVDYSVCDRRAVPSS